MAVIDSAQCCFIFVDGKKVIFEDKIGLHLAFQVLSI